MPDTPVRWGIAGTGRIAGQLAADLALSDGGVLQAVGSRSADRAAAFAAEHGATTAHGSYGALLDDPDVDAVYIATPHRQHHALALAGIDAGKHLLVEKAFTCTLDGTREVVAAARAAGLFCMEAMWTRFQPAIVTRRRLLADGAIGDGRSVRADFGRKVPYDPSDRLWDAAQGGGALLDLGVYPIAFIQSVLEGAPAGLHVTGTLAPNGVDADAVVTWHADDGRAGVGQCSLAGPLPCTAAVFGTDGWIALPPPFHHPDRVVVYGTAGEHAAPERTITAPATGRGYVHELDEVHRCLAQGLTESPVMPLDDTVLIMGVLERALHTLGVHFDEGDVPL